MSVRPERARNAAAAGDRDVMGGQAMSEGAQLQAANVPTDACAQPASPPRAPLGLQVLTLLGVILPPAGLLAAAVFFWGWGFSWVDLGVFLGMYLLTALGITVGFHRLFVHRSFDTYMWVKAILAILGSMAVQGPLIQWVGLHRRHHQHSDTPDDPHSPTPTVRVFLA